MHAAKGLEFPVVILAGLSDTKTGDKLPIRIGTKPEKFGIKVPDPDADYDMKETPVFAALHQLFEEKELAERKRLLYVGMTRAKDHLILSGTRPKEKISSIADGKSKMDWLCTVFDINPQSPPPEVEFSVDGGDIKISVITDNDENEYMGKWKHTIHSGDSYSIIQKPARKKEKKGTIQLEMSRLKESPSHSPKEKTEFRIPGADHLEPDQLGTLIHEIFSGISAELVLKRYGIDDAEAIKVCQDYYERFKTLEILQSVDKDKEYKELSCSLFLPDIDVKLKGAIDRLCRTDDGWIIIDYKTGMADPKEFQPVLEAYCRAAERLVQEPVTAYLYEIPSQKLISVERMKNGDFSSLIAAKAREFLS
jgi:ATP-dependent helicase/nuclease subunit A